MQNKITVLLPLSVFTCVAAQAQKHAADNDLMRPNVLIIYADDIGYGDFSCNGATTISTPNVDRLARQGVRFTNAHSAAATSTPSRYAMLTGEYAWRKAGTGIADGDAASIITSERYTMADMFRDAGYTTGVVGKWHLGLGSESGKQNWNEHVAPGANEIGFDYSFIMAATGDRVPCVFVENGNVVNLDPNDPIEVNYKKNFEGEPTGKNNPELLKMHPSNGHNQSIVNGISRIGFMRGGKKALWKDEEIAHRLTDTAISFIQNHKDKPFFLYFATQDAHVPRCPSPEFVGKSGMGPRGDCLLEFDWSVGMLLDALERMGLDENTLIVLSSDNGPVVDDGYCDQAKELLGAHKPAGIYRGGKYSAYEAATRVPCIWSLPGMVREGVVSDALLCQVDWMATFAQMLQINLPEGAAPDSEPLLKAWCGKEHQGREWLVLQNANNNLSLTDGRWKYIRPGKGASYDKYVEIELGNSAEPQLYDLKQDPSEQKNLAGKKVKKLKKMSAKLEQIVDGRYNLPLHTK